jgi:hypothetical protein
MQPVLNINIIEMEKESFEKKLKGMTKPEISHLKHEDMLAKAIINAKDKSVLSLWWLSIPVFIILMLLMKSVYMPGTDLITSIHELAGREKYISVVFFLISPLLLIIINAASIRKIYYLYGNPKSINFLQVVWFNIAIIALSIVILLVYTL